MYSYSRFDSRSLKTVNYYSLRQRALLTEDFIKEACPQFVRIQAYTDGQMTLLRRILSMVPTELAITTEFAKDKVPDSKADS